MKTKSIGFIGGGRITRIFLKALFCDETLNAKIVVSELDAECLDKIGNNFPLVKKSTDNKEAAKQEIVFIALHPPIILNVLREIKMELNEETILISLAPKLNMSILSENLNSHNNIVRCIPNSPSIIRKGYNPLSFYEKFNENIKSKVFEIFKNFGKYFEVEESKLEAYAIITAMGPTYFQFQVKKLLELSEKFGLNQDESVLALKNMFEGMNSLLFDSDLDYEQILDLIPVRPIKKSEQTILEIYDNKLIPLYEKLTS